MNEQTELREEDKAENQQTVADATAGPPGTVDREVGKGRTRTGMGRSKSQIRSNAPRYLLGTGNIAEVLKPIEDGNL